MAAGFADDDGHDIDSLARISCINVDPGIDNAARSQQHRALLPPPGTSLWDWQVVTAWCCCTTRPTLGAMHTCTTIAVNTTMTARMTEAWTKTVRRGVAEASGGGGMGMMSEICVILGTWTKLETACGLLFSGGEPN